MSACGAAMHPASLHPASSSNAYAGRSSEDKPDDNSLKSAPGFSNVRRLVAMLMQRVAKAEKKHTCLLAKHNGLLAAFEGELARKRKER